MINGSRLRGYVLLSATLLSGLDAEGLYIDMTTREVEAAVGAPASKLARGDRAIWNYPEGGRVEFALDRVVGFSNMPMATDAEIQVTEPTVAEAPTATLPAEVADASAAAAPADEAVWSVERAADSVTVADAVAQLEAMHDQGPRARQQAMLPPPKAFSWAAAMVEALFSLLLTVVVLKMAFKWSDIHADWGQMFTPAAADVLTGFSIVALAQVFLGTDHLFHLDHALSYLVLVVVLRKTTHASSLARAVSVAGVAKVASIVLWSILSVLILQGLFG
jgi:hypothetical protein